MFINIFSLALSLEKAVIMEWHLDCDFSKYLSPIKGVTLATKGNRKDALKRCAKTQECCQRKRLHQKTKRTKINKTETLQEILWAV